MKQFLIILANMFYLSPSLSPFAPFAVSLCLMNGRKSLGFVNVSLGTFSNEIRRGEVVRSKRDLYSVVLLL